MALAKPCTFGLRSNKNNEDAVKRRRGLYHNLLGEPSYFRRFNQTLPMQIVRKQKSAEPKPCAFKNGFTL
ncbi:hypothetical protein P3385_09855 [Vibrio parahaemolyticus]|nr:hypothetical protein [Vibrio parahaemolyticus]MDF4427702.1 hypothetical protein [Vibrio parahaemolyticus]MDF4436895.1 hypothetical protein [Vibrio parahaemolyticus]MDF4446136.1 hypothetical protein [Vibrio parahaemolyticus]